MQDNIVYRLELTDKEFEFIENLRKELYDKLSINGNRAYKRCHEGAWSRKCDHVRLRSYGIRYFQ